ncbi:MAG TPA: hypothetical protein VKZ63_14620 [Kofleriaceae bacterium]|nr:hypothetical protein [Kofleriaceae bacterium]
MSGARRRLPGLEGWILVLWAALAVGGMTAAILAARGADLDGVRAGLRATARTSLVLFLAAMAASSLRRLWPVPLTAWLLRNRRYLGVSFAASHAIHLALIASLVPVTPERFTDDPAGLIPGATAYLFVLLLTVTSFDRVADRLGRAWWKRLHLAGCWWIWVVFAGNYTSKIARGPGFAAAALALWAVAALRLWRWTATRGRSRRPPRAGS